MINKDNTTVSSLKHIHISKWEDQEEIEVPFKIYYW